MNFAAELSRKADERLDRVCAEATTGNISDLRTKLDEWKAFRVGGDLVTCPGLRQRWLNNPCPWQHHARLRAHMDWITPEAMMILERGAARDPAVRKPNNAAPAPYRIIVEHALPVRVLRELILSDPCLWRRDQLERFLMKWFQRGVLTKNEDARLTEARLKQRMPSGWRLGDSPFARYYHVGLQHA